MVGRTALGKYRLLRPLGSGGNAEVFLAEPTGGGPRVVVKRVHDHVTRHPKFRQLFCAEVVSMANFRHPYAVHLLDAAIDDPLGPCLVMEYVPGVTLEALLARRPAMDADRVGRLLGYLGHALQAAHTVGIIHRDLKPANLMVQNAGTTSESLKVMDFGFAGFAAQPHIQLAELTGRGPVQALGTPAYVSPEMIRGDTVDTRSDLYSVGVVLYELLTGRLPFTHDRQDRLLAAHLNDSPPAFAKAGAAGAEPGVEAAVQLALAKYPNERPQSARQLVEVYGRGLGVDYWAATLPAGWVPPAAPDLVTTPAPLPRRREDPFRITHEFEAAMPERLAAAKLRGFVEDLGGQVVASEPGLIRLRVGVPAGYSERSPSGSGIINWFRSVARPSVAPGQEPVELELHMAKPDPSKPRLHVVAAFRPLKDFPPTSSRLWRDRCDRLNATLRRYLGT